MGEDVTLSLFKMYIVGNDGQYSEVGELKEPLPSFEPEPSTDKSSVMTINPHEEIVITVHQTWWQRHKTKRAFRKIFGRKLLRELRKRR